MKRKNTGAISDSSEGTPRPTNPNPFFFKCNTIATVEHTNGTNAAKNQLLSKNCDKLSGRSLLRNGKTINTINVNKAISQDAKQSRKTLLLIKNRTNRGGCFSSFAVSNIQLSIPLMVTLALAKSIWPAYLPFKAAMQRPISLRPSAPSSATTAVAASTISSSLICLGRNS